MNNLPVYFNDLGLVCSLGDDKGEIYSQLISSRSNGLKTHTELMPERPLTLGEVTTKLPLLNEYPLELQTRTNQLLRAAYLQVETVFLKAKENVPANRIAIVLGTSTSGIAETETAITTSKTTIPYPQQNLGNPAHALAQWADIEGPSYAISTACTSGAKALASARRLLRSGMFDLVLAGGVDSLCKLTLNGFLALEAMSTEPCQPFSKNRSGINIGEGAALFVMSRQKGPICLSGVGESSDAHHISAPDPEGSGAKLSIGRALNDATLTAGDIDYLNLHGTATEQNDRMEASVVHDIFGAETPCSSTKGYTGHTLGAAGAIEAAFCYLALKDKCTALPLHRFDGCYDPEIAEIGLVSDTSRPTKIAKAMSNSFAFGGNNISLIMERTQ